MEENMGLPDRLTDQCADAGTLPALASVVAGCWPLVRACMKAFTSHMTEVGTDDISREPDDEDVSHPPCGITFGMIRTAIRSLNEAACAGHKADGFFTDPCCISCPAPVQEG